LQFWAKQQKKPGNVWVVHRLDKEVSGILLFAKSATAMEQIKANWAHTEKVYQALVEGQPKTSEGTIHNWLKEKDDRSMLMKIVAPNTPDSKEAITHYRTLKTLGPHTLLEVHLETGRKNQIRVHLSGIGCPIVGDRRYGANDSVHRRVRLHATNLRFTDPDSGDAVNLESKIPPTFLKLLPGDET
jgi:23S rRNA pseudouridine1911/1915/1917 synthase